MIDEFAVINQRPMTFPKDIDDFLKSLSKKEYSIVGEFQVTIGQDGVRKEVTHKIPHTIEFYSASALNLCLLMFDKWYEHEPYYKGD